MRRKIKNSALWERGMNPEQLDAINHDNGPCRVMASPGSGKTRAVVHRIARMVIRDGVDPDQILAVTFSKKAAIEMQVRCATLGVSDARIGTWHSLCLQILREDCTKWATWEVDEKDRARSILKEIIGYRGMDWKEVDFGKLRAFIGLCKANLYAPDSEGALELAQKSFGFQANLALEAFSRFQHAIEEAHLLTFDDYLVFVVEHLSDETNRARWASKWTHVIQDEAQDANRAQKVIGELLARDHRNYMVVGDPAQSIYSFRGSSPSFFLAFVDDWSGAKDVILKRNYRSGSSIVDVVNAAIRPSKTRLPEDMLGAREERGSVALVRTNDFDHEASECAAWIEGGIQNGAAPSDYCVLYRTNAQSRAVEEKLLERKIPYVVVGGVSFYERKEVRDLLAYLTLAAGHDDDHDAVRRCINAPFRFLGSAFVARVSAHVESGSSALAAVDAAAGEAGVQARQRASAADWASLITEAAEDIKRNARPAKILNRIIERTKYITWLEHEEGAESPESSPASNVRELVRVADRFATVPDLLDFIEKTMKAAKKQRRDEQAGGERVLLMSIHRSKGLEWPNVWLIGANEKVLPHAAATDIDEERRLFYVATSRARDSLVVSFVSSMATRAGISTATPSRFLLDAFGREHIDVANSSVMSRGQVALFDKALEPRGDAATLAAERAE